MELTQRYLKSILAYNTSGASGVTWFKRTCKWWVRVPVNGKRRSFGLYVDFNEAVKVRKNVERSLGFHKNHGRVA